MDLFALLHSDPVLQEFHRQEARDPERVNLTDLWRAACLYLYGAGDSPWLSPRRWRKSYGWPEAVELEGTAADDPAWADASTALNYVFDMDDSLRRAFIELVRIASRQDPVGMMLLAPGAAVRARLADLVCAWDRGSAWDIIAEIARRTAQLGYAQEAKVAEVQRAFFAALVSKP
jgi:hypothetical protein